MPSPQLGHRDVSSLSLAGLTFNPPLRVTWPGLRFRLDIGRAAAELYPFAKIYVLLQTTVALQLLAPGGELSERP
jgi:hypothetical protein